MPGRPFRSVLIANRGEIAVRIIRACREAGLRAIAVYSDADAGAMHVRRADEAHRIGPPPAAESYLNTDAILNAARQCGAEAIHPGYGFLSEHADFAAAVGAAGLVWIGPPAAAMRLLGDKAAAKALAERAGVPTLPGYHGDAQDDATLTAETRRIGFPLLVKAAAGGGGRGMRVVREESELAEALSSARREAKSGFGDDRLLLERFLERPRHVEMQLLGDEHGTLLYLGERDCSIQRRHQKIIEEAPAPNFTVEQRRAMGVASVALARAAGYTNAGTVEFLLDHDGQFYFLEVNTRLQVEHPVTEMVTGLDLVRLQLEMAAGQPLGIRQDDVQIRGHALECRLYAEEPARGYLPSAGRVTEFSMDFSGPEPTFRADTGIEPGDVVSPYYDPLLAKLVFHHQQRTQTIRLAEQVMGGVVIGGVRTNLELLKYILGHREFQAAKVHTGFIQDHDAAAASGRPDSDQLLATAAAAGTARGRLGLRSSLARPALLWQEFGCWRTGWVGASVTLGFDGRPHQVGFTPPALSGEDWRFELDGTVVERRLEIYREGSVEFRDRVPARLVRLRELPGTDRVEAALDHHRQVFELLSGLEPGGLHGAAEGAHAHDVVTAPLTGRVVKLMAEVGQQVSVNQTLVVLEAMKIEQLVAAPRDGVVEQVHCREGETVDVGAALVELEER